MKILLSGSSGLVGSALYSYLGASGHAIKRLMRAESKQAADDAYWNPDTGAVHLPDWNFDAVIHLGGANVAEQRWTKGYKQTIRDSRVRSTELLARALANLPFKPKHFIVASAIGYYGDRGDEILSEQSSRGTGFLPGVCEAWEAAARPAVEAGIRVVHLRIGVVLSGKGGALKKMLVPYRAGLGGKIGPGTQYVSWISLSELTQVIDFVLHKGEIHGPVNAVAPEALRQKDFSDRLARILHRPAFIPMPSAVLRITLGEMADELLLSSTNVRPAKLLEHGYTFRFPELEQALRHEL